ncbi:MAG: hypothetical protein ABIT64_03470 [Lysobacteraceae bacterium]
MDELILKVVCIVSHPAVEVLHGEPLDIIHGWKAKRGEIICDKEVCS